MSGRTTLSINKQTPQLARARRLEQLDTLEANSRVYDSRLEIWCARAGMCPTTAREWLAEGHIVTFSGGDGRELFRIRPGELV